MIELRGLAHERSGEPDQRARATRNMSGVIPPTRARSGCSSGSTDCRARRLRPRLRPSDEAKRALAPLDIGELLAILFARHEPQPLHRCAAGPIRSRRSIGGSTSTNCCRPSTSARRRPTAARGSARASRAVTRMTSGRSRWSARRAAPGDDTARIYQLYVDASDEPSGLSGRIGRQSLFGSGVFGRFDGVRLGWQASPAVELHAQAGFPVYSTRTDRVIRDRRFYGFSVDYAPPDANYAVTAYWLDQRSHGYVDRRLIRDRRALHDQGDRAVRAGRCRCRVRQAQPPVPQRDDPDGRRGEPFDPGRPAILSAAFPDQRGHRPARPAARGAQAAVRPADARAACRGSLGAQPQPDR